LYDSDSGLATLEKVLQLADKKNPIKVKSIKRIKDSREGLAYLKTLEVDDYMSSKRIILDCEPWLTKNIIVDHIRDIYLGRRTFHYLLPNFAMDDYLSERVAEFGAVNITGFRI